MDLYGAGAGQSHADGDGTALHKDQLKIIRDAEAETVDRQINQPNGRCK